MPGVFPGLGQRSVGSICGMRVREGERGLVCEGDVGSLRIRWTFEIKTRIYRPFIWMGYGGKLGWGRNLQRPNKPTGSLAAFLSALAPSRGFQLVYLVGDPNLGAETPGAETPKPE